MWPTLLDPPHLPRRPLLKRRPSRVLGEMGGDLGVPGLDYQAHLSFEGIELELDPAQPGTDVGRDFLPDVADAQHGSEKESYQRPRSEDQSGHLGTPVYFRYRVLLVCMTLGEFR